MHMHDVGIKDPKPCVWPWALFKNIDRSEEEQIVVRCLQSKS